MTWEEVVWKVLVPLLVAAILSLGGVVLRLWKASNPHRQEAHFRQSHDQAQLLTGHEGRLSSCETAIREGRHYGIQIARLEVEVGHVKDEIGHVRSDTGAIKIAVDSLVRQGRANGGK